jgi:hypothetical protein
MVNMSWGASPESIVAEATKAALGGCAHRGVGAGLDRGVSRRPSH